MTELQRIAISPSQLQNGQIMLTPQQVHYLCRVLRLQEGDRFIVMDGMGKWWLAQLEGETAQVLESLVVETELPIAVTLMVALPKGQAFDDVVRYCTELGVIAMVPVMSDRTLLNPSPQKLERWRRIAQEAAEQSERAIVPTILEPIAFSKAIVELTATHRYICEARGNLPHLQQSIHEIFHPNTSTRDSCPLKLVGEEMGERLEEIILATGPEGGWTQKELESAIAAGFQPVSLGRRIFRAVTAPIVALSLVAGELESVHASIQDL
ncbi:MAG: 16S rRNA (uracil(1498)-N(3))-methyltransferase [Nostocaceae cyanobacterium]|nr:16S rRNA (uracil(1498)-N(3))-methyltransferase [Nostocaceae cyanobacterium]